MAVSPPFQLVAPTDGTPGAGSPAGSTTTKGMLRARRRAACSSLSSETTRMTPRGAPRGDGVDPRAPERAGALLGGEDDAELVLARDLLDAADDLDRPRALELVEDHVEQRRARRSRDGARRR